MTQDIVMVDRINYVLSYNGVLSEEQKQQTINQIRLQTNNQNNRTPYQYNNRIVSVVTGCNKTSGVVGDVIHLFATPSGGPEGTSYTMKAMKKIGSGSEVTLDTKTSTGTEVTYDYTVVSEDNNANVQFWYNGSYLCADDGTTKTGSSTKCNVAIGETPTLYRCNQTTGQCEPCNGTSAQDCYDDCITKCGYDFECLMKCIEECEGGTPTPTSTPTSAPCVPLEECQAQCGATTPPTTIPPTTKPPTTKPPTTIPPTTIPPTTIPPTTIPPTTIPPIGDNTGIMILGALAIGAGVIYYMKNKKQQNAVSRKAKII